MIVQYREGSRCRRQKRGPTVCIAASDDRYTVLYGRIRSLQARAGPGHARLLAHGQGDGGQVRNKYENADSQDTIFRSEPLPSSTARADSALVKTLVSPRLWQASHNARLSGVALPDQPYRTRGNKVQLDTRSAHWIS
jgi:hypothetical protein